MSDPAGFNGLIGSRTCCSKCQIQKHQRSPFFPFSPAIKNAQFVLLSLKKRNKSEDRPVSKVILASLFCLSSHFSRLSSISQNVEDSRATSVLTNTPNPTIDEMFSMPQSKKKWVKLKKKIFRRRENSQSTNSIRFLSLGQNKHRMKQFFSFFSLPL